MKPVSTIVVVVFALVAVVHLMRIIQGWEVIVNGITSPCGSVSSELSLPVGWLFCFGEKVEAR